jgi:hypothetical protein
MVRRTDVLAQSQSEECGPFGGGESVKLCNEFSIGAGVKTLGRIAR